MDMHKINSLALTCGVIGFALGLTVLLGWYIHNTALIQINPAFAPMQYNTALGFLLSGSSLIALIFQKRRTAQIFGLVVILIGAATLLEYILNINFGIDQLFMDQSIMTKTSHPGRMAPNTALCFALFGMALTCNIKSRQIRIGAAAAVLALSALAFAGYLINEESIYGWGNLTRMAIHTASGFVILSFGLLNHEISKARVKAFDLWTLAPFSLATIVIVFTFFSWYIVRESTQERNKDYFHTLVYDTQKALKERYMIYEQALRGGLGLFRASSSVQREEWRKYVATLNIGKTLPGINGLGYIDFVLAQDVPEYIQSSREDGAPNFKIHPDTFYPDKFVIRFIEPSDVNQEAIGLDIGFEANRRAAAERARDLGVSALTKKIELVQDHQKQAGFLLLIPSYESVEPPKTLEARRAGFQGWVYAPFIGSNFLSDLTDVSKGQLAFQVYDGKQDAPNALIYSSDSKFIRTATEGFAKTTHMKIAERAWLLKWRTTDAFEPPADQSIAHFVAIIGGVFAVFLYFMLSQLVHQRRTVLEKVARRTKDLNKARKEAERANAMKSEFLANISHELRTPLNGIIGATDLLKDLKINKLQKQYVDIIFSSGNRLLSLINDVLDLSKIEAGETKLRPSDVQLEKLVTATFQLLSVQAQQKNISIDLRYSSDIPPMVSVDELKLAQILTNLLGNAIKFTDKGGVTLDVSLVGSTNDLPRVRFEIIDTGIGIPKDRVKTVFDKFSQIDSSSTKKQRGTGLGLSISKQLVELMDGDIGVTSALNKGTTFWFELDLIVSKASASKPDVPAAVEDRPHKDKSENSEKTALLVEDEAVNTIVATKMLTTIGFAVDAAENGLQAVEMMENKSYDVVFMDCSMPIMDGYEATKRRRENEVKSGNRQLIVAMTANALEYDRQKCLDAGMDDYLAKPILKALLEEKLQELGLL